jgi:hypothetical protein
VVLAAGLGLLCASLRAPTIILSHVASAQRLDPHDGSSDEPRLVPASERGLVPAARPARADAARSPRMDGALGPAALLGGGARADAARARLAEHPRAPRGTWARPAPSRAELMVFLN